MWNGGPYSGLSSQTLNARAYGASLQLTDTNELAGRPNHLVVGASFDGSDSLFSGRTCIGGFDPYSREFIPPGVVQVQPDEGVNPVKVQDTNQYYGIYRSGHLDLVPEAEPDLRGPVQLRADQSLRPVWRPGQREQHLRSLQSERRVDLSSCTRGSKSMAAMPSPIGRRRRKNCRARALRTHVRS